MTSSGKDRYYPTVGKSRRTSQGDSQTAGFFSTGQVPSPYSNAYTQPRSAPNKLGYELDPQALYGAYPASNATPQFPTGMPNYEIHHERYSPQPSYPTSYGSRSSPPLMTNPADSRRLPPLSTSSPPPGERWQQQAFVPSTGYPAHNIRSPTATYPTPNHFMQYSSNHGNAYQYHMSHDHVGLNPQHNGFFDEMPRVDHRSNSPFRATGSSHHGHVPAPPPQSFTPPPISPTTAEETTIKKKRKRADANQLKVLNETYARTAFPSTEERLALAKMLDMTARSVQIWFQNKRQSMRQTNRQSSNVSSSAHHPFSVSSQVDPMTEELVAHSSGYDGSGSLNDPLYLTSAQDASRSHSSHSHPHSHSHYGSYHSSSHRHRD
ncbi:hypothetical protein CPB83DRAFT_861914 [Crepidotus variabilis]|uniref:Homeobox domain-containing protein n=1 Tax=Crepidotus variabilis TaxID=179855 RepID=A0A9P6E7C6_9AGAR|nr:hypothetical protein CPB83DRAFT_861914 [Crepidotus variabilis]